jgi:SHS2 domain-containing protein
MYTRCFNCTDEIEVDVSHRLLQMVRCNGCGTLNQVEGIKQIILKTYKPDDNSVIEYLKNSTEMYLSLDHTADLRIAVWGPHPSAVFQNSVYAMFDLLVDCSTLHKYNRVNLPSMNFDETSLERLFLDCLSEVHYIFETEHKVSYLVNPKVYYDHQDDVWKLRTQLVQCLVPSSLVKIEIKNITSHMLVVKEDRALFALDV